MTFILKTVPGVREIYVPTNNKDLESKMTELIDAVNEAYHDYKESKLNCKRSDTEYGIYHEAVNEVYRFVRANPECTIKI